LKLYLEAFETCRRSRNTNPIQAIIEIIKTIHIITATTYLVKSESDYTCKFNLYNVRRYCSMVYAHTDSSTI